MSNLDYVYRSVIIPATTHRPNCRILVFSTPPSTPAHEFLDYVERAEYEGGHIKLTIYDNPMVNSATIARLMKESGGANSTTWRREYLCEHITDAQLAIVSEWKEEYVQDIPRDDYYWLYHKYVAMDLGVGDFTAVLFGYYDFRRAALVIENELVVNGPELTTEIIQILVKMFELRTWTQRRECLTESTSHDSIDTLLSYILKMSQAQRQEITRQWEIESPKVYLRISDNNNPLLLQDLSFLHGLHFTGTDKGTLEEMVNAVKMMVLDGKILVNPRCKQLSGCLKNGVWDKNRRKFAYSTTYGHFDALAALIYLVRNLNKHTNPIPHDFRVDLNNSIVFPDTNRSQSITQIKEAFKL